MTKRLHKPEGLAYCWACASYKVRKADPKGMREKTVFRDADGRRWHGRRCPDCADTVRESNRDPYQKYCAMCARSGAIPLTKDAWQAIHYK